MDLIRIINYHCRQSSLPILAVIFILVGCTVCDSFEVPNVLPNTIPGETDFVDIDIHNEDVTSVLPEPEAQVQHPLQPNVYNNDPNSLSSTFVAASVQQAREGTSCLHTRDCDAANTVLTCHRGKCTCPNRPLLNWTRGPLPLNTQWEPSLNKCLALRDAACDVYFPKSVYCQLGLVCRGGDEVNKGKPANLNAGFGTCGDSGVVSYRINYFLTFFLSTFVISMGFMI